MKPQKPTEISFHLQTERVSLSLKGKKQTLRRILKPNSVEINELCSSIKTIFVENGEKRLTSAFCQMEAIFNNDS